MRVTFEVPDDVWFRYASIAEDHHVSVREVFAEQVRQFVHVVDNPELEPLDALAAELREARRAGFRAPQRGRAARERAEEQAWLREQVRLANLRSFQVRDEEAAMVELAALLSPGVRGVLEGEEP